MDKILEKIIGKSPGLDVAVLVITALMVPLMLRKDTMEEWGLLIVPFVWFGSLLLSRLSGKLDDWVFGPLYGTFQEKDAPFKGFVRRSSSSSRWPWIAASWPAGSMRKEAMPLRLSVIQAFRLAQRESTAVPGQYFTARSSGKKR